MMTALVFVFLVLALAGAATGKFAVALMSLGMMVFCLYAEKVFDKQDQQALEDPAHARKEPDTLEILDREGCECCVPEIPNRFSKSDLET
jgi:hypothetical protein